MIIFSERINGMYRDVRQAINEKNKQIVQDLVRTQVAGGADVIDINLGPTKGDPVENFVWLAGAVSEVTDKPLSLDSAKPHLLVQVVPKVRALQPQTRLVINSSTAAAESMAKLIPLAAAHGAGIIGLTMDQEGVPGNVEKRVECGATFLMAALEAGIAPQDVYLDPIMMPLKHMQDQAKEILKAASQFQLFSDPPCHVVCGLSNVSIGTTHKKLINRVFTAMLVANGLDAIILDVLDEDLVNTILAAELIMNRFIFADSFVEAFRQP